MSHANVTRITQTLCDESWEGRWSPLREMNIRPLAEHTAVVLDSAGFVLIQRSDLKHLVEVFIDNGMVESEDEEIVNRLALAVTDPSSLDIVPNPSTP